MAEMSWVLCTKWVTWHVIVGSVHETGEVEGCHRFCEQNGWPGGAYWVNIGSMNKGGSSPGAPHRPNLLFQVVRAQ